MAFSAAFLVGFVVAGKGSGSTTGVATGAGADAGSTAGVATGSGVGAGSTAGVATGAGVGAGSIGLGSKTFAVATTSSRVVATVAVIMESPPSASLVK